MTGVRWTAALPPLLAGAALALGMQVAAGLLLYGGPGFLPALSVVLATGSGALAAGLLSRSRTELGEGVQAGVSAARSGGRFLPGLPPGSWVGQDAVDEVRRRWLGLLLAFTAAATFAAGWEFFRGFGARGTTQGLGLALLVALPMYAGGRLLASGGFGVPRVLDSSRGGGVGAPVLAGAGLGLLALGHVLFPALSPTAVLLLCVVATSGGALLHGWLLDEVILLDAEVGDPVGVRVRWRRTRPALEGVTWIHGGGAGGGRGSSAAWVTRGGDGEPFHAEEKAVESGILPMLPSPARVVAVGWDALPVALSGVVDRVPVEGVDPSAERVAWLASELDPDESLPPRVDTTAASLEGWIAGNGRALADRVVVGAEASGGLPLARDRGWWMALSERVAPGGVVLVLGLEEGPDGEGLLRPLTLGGEILGEGSAWVAAEGSERELEGATGRRGFLLFRKGAREGVPDPECGQGGAEGGTEGDPLGSAGWPERIGAFTRVPFETLSEGWRAPVSDAPPSLVRQHEDPVAPVPDPTP